MTSTTVAQVFTDLMSDVGDTLILILPEVFAFVGILIALFFGLRLVRRYLGRSK